MMPSGAQRRPFALVGGTLIDGTGGSLISPATVLVEGRTISQVGPADRVQPGAHVQVYDISGKTIMPGLIDGHVHLLAYAGEGEQDIHMWNVVTFVEEQTLHAAANARIALESGVTTVRDTAGSRPEIAVKHAIDQFVLDGARIVASGFVGMTAGHGDMFVPAGIERRLWQTADGVDECRKLVRQYARDGVDWIKICTSGGVLSVGDEAEWRNYSLAETCAIVDEAHALSKRVTAHAHSRSGIKQALDAGVDCIEHGSMLDDSLIEMMLRQGTWLCPTLALSEFMTAHGEQRGVPAASMAKARAMQQVRFNGAQRAYAAGVKILTGTDSCNTMPFGRHAWELELMQRHLGMTPMETIVASTHHAAVALGLGEQTGTIEQGKWADLLVVDGDPVADVRILQNRERLLGVVRDGRLLINRGLVPTQGAMPSARERTPLTV